MQIANKPMADSPKPIKSAQRHILIVDDDFDMTDTLKTALDSAGFETTVAADGNVGLAVAETRKPDLIILDIMMPRRSGFLVLERLRQELEEPIPVIMVTGNFGERHRAYAEMLGVAAYFYKPVKFQVLLQKIEELLGGEDHADD